MPYGQVAVVNATTGQTTYRDLTPAEVADRDAMAAADAAATTSHNNVKGQITTLAQSAVGVPLADLTQAQIKALMACLLFNAGGVDPATLQVRPLAQWVT